MGFTVEDKRLMVARASCPDLHAAKDTVKRHDLPGDDIAYKAFMWLWAARGRYSTLERMISKPVSGQKEVPHDVARHLSQPKNRKFLNRLMAEANGLHQMYKSL